MANMTLWKLRRLASRAVRVVDRRATDSPALAAFAPRLKPTANAFIAAYDKARTYEAAWRNEMTQGKSAVAELLKCMRSWLPLLQRDIPGFDSASFGDRPTVPDDVLEDAGRMHDMVHDAVDAGGQPLAYRDALLADLEPKKQRAPKEWAEVEAADKQLQALLASVRAAADTFNKELIAFRNTLAAVVGRRDKDYQKLRTDKAHRPDEDDDPAGPPPPPPVPPADAGTSSPTG
jgi:hypothetical protein